MKPKTSWLAISALCASLVASGCGDDDDAAAPSGAGTDGGSASQAGKAAGGKASGGSAAAGRGQGGEPGGAPSNVGGQGGHDDAGELAGAGMGGAGDGGNGGDAAVCGDGLVTGAETCDDGETNDADGCSATCEVEHVLDIGHIDLFSVVYDDATSALKLQVKENSELYRVYQAYWKPESVTIDVDPSRTAVELPDERFAFIGPVGSTAYLLPMGGSEAEGMGVPWPGWESYGLVPSLPDGVEPADMEFPLHVEIEVTQAPGGLFTFFSPEDEISPPTALYVNSVDAAPDIIPMAASSHTHTNWAFSAVGDYYFTAKPSLITKSHGTLTGPARTFHFHVGAPLVVTQTGPVLTVQSEPPAPYEAGANVDLTASFEPADVVARIEWYHPGEPDEFQQIHPALVPGEHGKTFSFVATATETDANYFPVLVNPANGRIYTPGP